MRIKPPSDIRPAKVRVLLPGELHAKLERYRAYLGPNTDMNYVIAEALRAFLATDREFQKRLAAEGSRRNGPASAAQ